jgi:hypothetical protein
MQLVTKNEGLEFIQAPSIGLLENKTGVPVFVLYLKSIQQMQVLELYSAKDVECLLTQTDVAEDKEALSSLFPFFETVGKRAIILLQPLVTTKNLKLKKMIGENKNIKNRTGIYALKNFSDIADVAVFPQVSKILTPSEQLSFYASLIELLESEKRLFVLIDFSDSLSEEERFSFIKKIYSPNIAAFSNSLVKENKIYSCLGAAAATIQFCDEKNGINHLPSNLSLGKKYSTLKEILPQELSRNLSHKINVFQTNYSGDLKLMGGYTLAENLDYQNKFISTRRTLRAIQDALTKICEPFVLEPLYSGVEKVMDVTLQSAFQSLNFLFDPEAKNPFETEVKIIKENKQDIISVQAKCFIPYSVAQMQIQVGIET